MTTRASAPSITEDTVRALAKSRNEPAWLIDRRLDAWRAFEAMSMPNPLEEEWRRTDISDLDLDAVLAALARQKPPKGTAIEAGSLGGPRDRAALVYSDLSAAAGTHRETVDRHLHSLVKATDWKLQALEAALWTGTFVYVPRNVEVEVPVMHLSRSREPGFFPHLLVVAEENSSVTIVQETQSPDAAAQQLVSGAVEIVCKPYARVRFVEVQRWGASAYAFSTVRAHLDQGAELTAALIGLGSRLNRTKLEVVLDGEGARTELLGLTLGDGKQHFDYNTLQDHIAPRTASDLLFKSALAGESSEVWYGTVRIGKGAGQSEANQTSRNLLLSDHAKAAPIPVLEIEAYDVLRCSHGATAGPLDEDQRFYLESRGIPPAETERLLVEAFFREVLDRSPATPAVRERVEKALLSKLQRSR